MIFSVSVYQKGDFTDYYIESYVVESETEELAVEKVIGIHPPQMRKRLTTRLMEYDLSKPISIDGFLQRMK